MTFQTGIFLTGDRHAHPFVTCATGFRHNRGFRMSSLQDTYRSGLRLCNSEQKETYEQRRDEIVKRLSQMYHDPLGQSGKGNRMTITNASRRSY